VASCELLFPFGPATFGVAWKATEPFIVVVAVIFFLPTFLMRSRSDVSKKSSLPDQALLIHCSAKNFQLYGMYYYYYYHYYYHHHIGRNSSVGIATRCGLDGSGIESRWGARFSTTVQTRPAAHPAS
jgi:hypothetical protein